jgi:hypothetical protein
VDDLWAHNEDVVCVLKNWTIQIVVWILVRAYGELADIYRRDGDKLAENWIFLDLLLFLSMQAFDVLARM